MTLSNFFLLFGRDKNNLWAMGYFQKLLKTIARHVG